MVVDVHVDHVHDLFMMCFTAMPLQMNFHSYLFTSPIFSNLPSVSLAPRCQKLIYTTLEANVFYPCTVQIFLLLGAGELLWLNWLCEFQGGRGERHKINLRNE